MHSFWGICRRSQEEILIVNLGVIQIVLAYFLVVFVFLCVLLSQTSVYCPEQMPIFFSFWQHLVSDFASLMFCQHVIGQSLSPASFLNLTIKNCETIIWLSCTSLLTNKIYCGYFQWLDKFLLLCHHPVYS